MSNIIRLPQKINLSTASDSYFKYAEKRFYELEAQRTKLGISILKKTIPLGSSIFIHLISSDIGSKIILMGGFPDILLSGTGSSALFSWESEAITTTAVSVGDLWLRNINPEYIISSGFSKDGQESTFNVHADTSINAKPAIISGYPAGYFTKYQLPVWFDESFISTVIDGERIDISSLAIQGEPLNIEGALAGAVKPVVSGALLYIPRHVESTWNFFAPVQSYIYNIVTGNGFFSSYWLPSLFYAVPGNGFYNNGWHYGKFMDWWESPNGSGDSLESIEVIFGAYLENRNDGAEKKYGYCEVVSKMNEETMFLLSAFIMSSPINHPGNPSDVYASRTGLKHGGTVPSGFDRTFSINLSSFFTEYLYRDPDIHMWGMKAEPHSTAFTVNIDAIGIVIRFNNKAVGYKYKGYLTEIFRTEHYSDHSVSHDGNIIALFESTEEGSTRTELVSAWDVYKPEIKELCKQAKLPPETFNVGEIIPRTEDKPIDIKGYLKDKETNVIEDDEDPSIWTAPYAYISYPQRGNGPVVVDKLLATATRAWIEHTVDECMESEITEYRQTDDFVTFNVDGHLYADRGLSGAIATLPKILFSMLEPPKHIVFAKFERGQNGAFIVKDACSGSSGTTKIVRTLNKTLTIGRTIPDDEIVIEGALGELTCSGCLDENCVEIKPCKEFDVDPCSTSEYEADLHYTATTSCGQHGDMVETITLQPSLEDVTIHVSENGRSDDLAVEESLATVSGGSPPYSWALIDESACWSWVEESENSIRLKFDNNSSGPGCCGATTLGVTDTCGNSASMELMKAIGHWETLGSVRNTTQQGLHCSSPSSIGAQSVIEKSSVFIGAIKYPEATGIETEWRWFGWDNDDVQYDIEDLYAGDLIESDDSGCWTELLCPEVKVCVFLPYETVYRKWTC